MAPGPVEAEGAFLPVHGRSRAAAGAGGGAAPASSMRGDMSRRAQLEEMRVIQRTQVQVVGLPASLSSAAVLKRYEYLGQYGTVLRVLVPAALTAAPSTVVYVTFSTV